MVGNRARATVLELSDLLVVLGDGLLRTGDAAAAARVAELREDEHLLLEQGHGVVPTGLHAFAALRAAILIHLLGGLDRHGFACRDLGMQKQVSVGLFHIAVHIGDCLAASGQDTGKVRGDQGLAGTPFAAGNRDLHD